MSGLCSFLWLCVPVGWGAHVHVRREGAAHCKPLCEPHCPQSSRTGQPCLPVAASWLSRSESGLGKTGLPSEHGRTLNARQNIPLAMANRRCGLRYASYRRSPKAVRRRRKHPKTSRTARATSKPRLRGLTRHRGHGLRNPGCIAAVLFVGLFPCVLNGTVLSLLGLDSGLDPELCAGLIFPLGLWFCHGHSRIALLRTSDGQVKDLGERIVRSAIPSPKVNEDACGGYRDATEGFLKGLRFDGRLSWTR